MTCYDRKRTEFKLGEIDPFQHYATAKVQDEPVRRWEGSGSGSGGGGRGNSFGLRKPKKKVNPLDKDGITRAVENAREMALLPHTATARGEQA